MILAKGEGKLLPWHAPATAAPRRALTDDAVTGLARRHPSPLLGGGWLR